MVRLAIGFLVDSENLVLHFKLFLEHPQLFQLPSERSTLVLGAPGSGKTFGTSDRMAESCMMQGFPLIVYDKHGSE